MNAIIRHDHYPQRAEWRARGEDGVVGFRSAEGFGRESASQPYWHVSPVRAKAARDERQLDLFRLTAACFGLAIYLGIPAAAVVYLGYRIVG